MNMLSQAMAFMASLGIKTPFSFRNSKHKSRAKSTRLAGKRSQTRLKIARGAGTISAKADIVQLVNANRYDEARKMAQDHERQCGERLFPNAWWHFTIIDEGMSS